MLGEGTGAAESKQETTRVKSLGLGYDKNATKQDLSNITSLQTLKQKYASKAGVAPSKLADKPTAKDVGKSELSKKISKSH